MNFGTNRDKAVRQAKANANSSGKPWRLFMWEGVYWVEAVGSGSPIDGEELFHPDPKTDEADA